MFTTPSEGEGKPREWEVKTLITIVEPRCCCFKLDDPQTNIVSLDWDESTINLQGRGGGGRYSLLRVSHLVRKPNRRTAMQSKSSAISWMSIGIPGFIISFKETFMFSEPGLDPPPPFFELVSHKFDPRWKCCQVYYRFWFSPILRWFDHGISIRGPNLVDMEPL